MDSYYAFSQSDSAETIEKVLKYDGDNFDIRKRGDISSEVAIIRFRNASFSTVIDAFKPTEMNRIVSCQFWIEQDGNISMTDVKYDRMDDLIDQFVRWVTQLDAGTVDMCYASLASVTDTTENNGYLTATVTLETLIPIQ